MSEPELFKWVNPVPTAWAEEVARLSPKLDRLSHLVLFWEPGFPADPIQRWVLFDAVPIAYVPEWKRQALFADPLCDCPVEASRIERCTFCRKLRSPGRKRAIQYLQRTECLPFPFWVIQGDNGGHLYQYTQTDVNWAKLCGQSGEPPVPGSLPYVPFDQRVIRRLRAYDRTRTAFTNLQTAAAHQEREAEQAFRKALAEYVDRSVESVFDELSVVRKSKLIDEIPRVVTEDTQTVDLAQEREAFIQGEPS